MAGKSDGGIDIAETRKLLVVSKREPVNCAIGLDSDGQALILLHKIKPGRSLMTELKSENKGLRNERFGTAQVDVDEDPKLVILMINKPAPGFARKLKKGLKGTGFSKVEIRLEDGSVAEAEGDEDEEQEGKAEAPNATAPESAATAPDAPPPPPPSSAATAPPQPSDAAAALTARLTDLVKQLMPKAASDPVLVTALKTLVPQAQALLKSGSLIEAGALIVQLGAFLLGGGEAPSAPPSGTASPAPAAMVAAPKIWHDAISLVGTSVSRLKDAIRKDLAAEPAALAEVEKNLDRIDKVVARFDGALADLIQGAVTAASDAARAAELVKARKLLAEHIKYTASEPMIGLIDANPFGVSPELKKTLSANLTQLAAAVR